MRARRALAALMLLALTAACDDSGNRADDPAPSASTSGSPSPSRSQDPSGSASPTVADPEHAMDPPGPRQGPIVPADMLVFSPRHPLSDGMVTRIKNLKGVDHVESLSLAQVVIENRSLTLAAVDPATYRQFTPAASAETREVWNRVAGGELALSPELRNKVPTDQKDYLRLGSADDAPQVHIGAYAPQVESAIDAVVNEKWGNDLGMPAGNALLISTGRTSPQSLRKPVEKIAGHRASVQALDVVARYGLDPGAQQTAYLVGTVADAVGTFNYTVLGGGHIAPDPGWVSSHITSETVPILGNVTCNRLIFPQLKAALAEVVQRGLADTIHPGEYGGCYNPRFIAGTTSLSNHSFGLALDLNVPGNQRGTVGEMDRTVVAIFEKWGFTWGGHWHYTDPMHFEMNALVNPR